MTHPLTPREKVAICGWCDGEKTVQSQMWGRVMCAHCRGTGVETYTALASGSGDHAELEYYGYRAFNAGIGCCHLVANPGPNDTNPEPLVTAASAKALLAENAALRAKLAEDDLSAQAEEEEYASKVLEWESVACLRGLRSLELERALSEHRIAADLLVSSLKSDLAKAERKLAEAVGLNDRAAELMRQCTDPDRFEGASTLNVYANMRSWLSDLSKEAERG